MASARNVLSCFLLSLLVADAPAQDIVGYVDATYDPNTGRIVVTVVKATYWAIRSVDDSPLFTGPDNAVQNGILPTPEGFLAVHSPTIIGEAWNGFNPSGPQLNYGPLALGRVAEQHIPMGKMQVWCECPFRGTQTDYFEVRYVPEPAALSLGGLMASAAFSIRPRRRGAT